MANPKHLEILHQGVEVWNRWRRESSSVQPDLREADLVNASLRNINLKDANLCEARLRGADLSKSYLRFALLREAKLSDADLSNADLYCADLQRADLSSADLAHARLTRANLRWVNLSGADLRAANLGLAMLHQTGLFDADLRSAVFYQTVLSDLDLSRTKNLDDCRHFGPSSLDSQTLRRFRDLPTAFLRGCGLSDEFIENIPGLFGRAVEYYSCFISYSSSDRKFAETLYADLQNNGIRCWFAPEDMKIGDPVRSTIEDAIRLRDKLVLILSATSIASDWVEHEVTKALEEEQAAKTVLFPIRIDDAVMQAGFGWAKRIRQAHEPGGRHIGDFTSWKDHGAYQESFERLLRDLRKSD